MLVLMVAREASVRRVNGETVKNPDHSSNEGTL
jgi:hypothetical protein